jgi:hypothetical protein
VQSHDGRQRNTVVLHAMIVATLRHLSPDVHDLSREAVKATIKRSRDYVLRAAMSGLSVENLQAFAIVAFIHVRHSTRHLPNCSSRLTELYR